MPDLKTVLTETLADHALDSDYCACGWRMSPDTGTSADWAAHVADVLLSLPGVAVTQLPDARDGEIDRLRTALADLIDPDDCWYDHNGDCQAHGFFGGECGHAVAKLLLPAVVLSEGETRNA